MINKWKNSVYASLSHFVSAFNRIQMMKWHQTRKKMVFEWKIMNLNMTNEARENIGQNKHEYRHRPLYSLLHSPGVVYQSARFIYACCHKLVSPAILMASDCLFVPNEFDAHSLYTKKTLIFSRINEKCMIQCVYVNTNDDWMRFFFISLKKREKIVCCCPL